MDFEFLQNPISKKWIVLAPRRAKRPDVANGSEPVCPFCVGREKDEEEVYRVPGNSSSVSQTDKLVTEEPVSDNREPKTDNGSDWLIRVLPNKFPFAPIHEVIIHSPDHHKNFDELPLDQVELILRTYRQRYQTHQEKGQVYIFHNRGEGGGESLPHPHSQLAVVPFEVKMDIPRLDPSASNTISASPLVLSENSEYLVKQSVSKSDSQTALQGDALRGYSGFSEVVSVETKHFYLFCPKTSQWPDEVWVAPLNRGRAFGEVTDEEISDLAFVLQRLIQILDLRHGQEFPFNFYIYPGGDWYLRLIPRSKSLGGFEIGTGIFVNTQNPQETIAFIKTHFHEPNVEKIKTEHQAEYERRV